MLVSVQEGYRLWSSSYDHESNALLALERRVIGERLSPLAGRCLLDIATGTGYWLRHALSRGARAFGLDLSAEMLAKAAGKPGLRPHLIRADMNVLPLKDSVADVAVCSLAVGYLPSVTNLFRELSRVSQSVIISDLHECAVQAGWQRCFEVAGRRYEIEQFEHSAEELDSAANDSGFRLNWRLASFIGEPEREIFIRNGREYAFEKVCRVPAILSTCWIQSGGRGAWPESKFSSP
jgi:malonyl-CoA O-methyltransferase